ncbi:hypothetical protein [Endozoicomonas sp. SCSIO W0465]|uniref:hypothetical protein n=1 Tax=Endozoicomonas sp. SCSIO W0465 TaxID=2918516 RepID=UPI00207562D5|nr:hypothetical protein [Endozoicomonas sp. SCSIO W0465]USE35044.1 hypothetical protein MJO57_23460 [Endozoicomonas sp. SCSIO W0465]
MIGPTVDISRTTDSPRNAQNSEWTCVSWFKELSDAIASKTSRFFGRAVAAVVSVFASFTSQTVNMVCAAQSLDNRKIIKPQTMVQNQTPGIGSQTQVQNQAPGSGSQTQIPDSGSQTQPPNLPIIPEAKLYAEAISSYLSEKTTLNEVLQRSAGECVKYMSPMGSFCVITIPDFPSIIIKIPDNQKQLECRSQSQNNAAHLTRENHFNRLIIPESRVVSLSIGKDCVPVIIEDMLPILNGTSTELLRHYANHEVKLESAIEQMAKFICMTKLSDIKPQNLPLMYDPETSEICFALVDLEVFPDRQFAEGILGCEQQPGEPAYGLLNYFPRYADKIAGIVRTFLPANEIECIEEALNRCVNKAHKIMDRERDIEIFHSRNGVVSGTPAIPQSIVEDILKKTDELRQSTDKKIAEIIPPNNKIVRKIISAINDEVSKKEGDWSSAVHGREWRLNMSRPQKRRTVDYIRTYFSYIDECLIPYLQEKGFVHSQLDYEQSKEHNIHIRREIALGEFDVIVQF